MPAAPPPAGRICLDCRSLLRGGDICGPPGEHRAVALTASAERQRLVDEVWSRHLVGGTGQLRYPRGARLVPFTSPGPRPPSRVEAVIEGEPALLSAATATPCVAYGLMLVALGEDAQPEIVLRDAYTAGFAARLGDGRRVVIGPGWIDVGGEGRRWGGTPPLFAFLRALDGGVRPLARDPLRFDFFEEILLRPGDAVEVVAGLDIAPDESQQSRGYREAAPLKFLASGRPYLRVRGSS